MADDLFSPEAMGEDDFGELGTFGQAPRGLRRGADIYFDGDTPGDLHQNYALEERTQATGEWNGGQKQYYYYYPPHQQQQPASDGYYYRRPAYPIAVPGPVVSRPGEEGEASVTDGASKDSEIEGGYNNGFKERFRGAIRGARGKRMLEEEVDWRKTERVLRDEQRARDKAVKGYDSQRRVRRRRFPPTKKGFNDRTEDAKEQITDTRWEKDTWTRYTKNLKDHQDNHEVLGEGWGWAVTNAPISTVTFSISGILPDNKTFMDPDAYLRVNRMLRKLTDAQITEQKKHAMEFFDRRFGIDFQSDGKPINSDHGSLTIPGLATLRPYAISPALQTRKTTAVSGNHPVETDESVHEAGWLVTVTAKKGAELGGSFGGSRGIPVKPGTTMGYGYWIFTNPKYEGDNAEMHFESSEPSLFGGASGHTTYNYTVHDLSPIDGSEHNEKGAWGHAVSISTERKIIGDRKKLGDLYGRTAARVQTTINITHAF